MTVQISWSGLRRFEECRYRHKLVISGKKNVAQDTRNFLPGTIADRIMRQWLEQDTPQLPGQMAAMVDEHFHRHTVTNVEGTIKWRGPRDQALVKNTVREAVNALEPLLAQHVLPFGYVPELKFRTRVKVPGLNGQPWGVELVGGIDIAVLYQEVPTRKAKLYDLKVTKNTDYASKVAGQMVFYAICFEYAYDIPVTSVDLVFPLFPKGRQIVPITIDAHAKADMMARVTRMAQAIWSREWTMPETRSPCQRCEMRPFCPRYAVPTPELDAKGRKTISFAKTVEARADYEPPVTQTDPIGALLGNPDIGVEPYSSRLAALIRTKSHE